MQKTEFLDRLRAALADLPAEELEKTLGYYAEMIEDRMEDGMDEEAAVAAMGDPEAVAREILLDAPLGTLVRAKIKPKRALSGWEILLLVLGAPLWLPLLATAAALLFTVYALIWSLMATLWALSAAVLLSGVAAAVGSVWVWMQNVSSGLFVLGGALACCGLGIFGLLGMKVLTAFAVRLTVKLLRATKSLFIRRRKEDETGEAI